MVLSIVIPARDDWESLRRLLQELGERLARFEATLEVLVVDDASRRPFHMEFPEHGFTIFKRVRCLRLRRNLSHQRAIAVGLMHTYTESEAEAILVMDADGEDTPDGAVKLLEEYQRTGGKTVVFAERSRRTESRLFRVFYWLYRVAHRFLTGQDVRVGNFSVVPRQSVGALAVMPELWNHFAAAVFRSGEGYTGVPIARGSRYAGRSRMNFVSLVVHGLSAISVYGDVIGARLLMATLGFSLGAFLLIGVVVGVRFLSDAAIPGWATYTVGILLILLVQMLSLSVSFTLSILAARSNLSFLPVRDFGHFVEEVREIPAHA